MKYKYLGLEFSGVLHPEEQLQIFINGDHLCYVDLDNYEEFGDVSMNELFKIIVEDLCDDNFEKLLEEIYFSNLDRSSDYYKLKYE